MKFHGLPLRLLFLKPQLVPLAEDWFFHRGRSRWFDVVLDTASPQLCGFNGMLLRPEGIEPPTSGLKGRYSAS